MKEFMTVCEASISKALGGTISIKEFEDEMQAISDAIENSRLTAESASDTIKKVSNDLIRSAEHSAMIQKRNAYKAKIRAFEVMESVEEGAQVRAGKKDRLFVATRAIVSGANTVFKRSMQSAHGRSKGIEGEYNGALIERLERDGLLATFQKGMKGDFEIQVVTAVSHLNTRNAKGEAPRIGNLTNAAYTDAVKIAKIIVDLQEALRQRLNRAGADVPRMDGFAGHTMHDPGKLRKAGFEKWEATIRPLLDWDRMGIPETRRDEFLKSAYNAMRTGVRKEIGADEPLATGFKGPKNLARSLSHSRMFHFKTPENWMLYSKSFGEGSYRDSIAKDIVMSAKNIAVLDTLTANPENFIDDIIAQIERKYRDTDIEAVEHLTDKKDVIFRDLDVVTGDINFGGHTTIAKVGEWGRTIATLSKLGASFISALSDIGLISTNRMYQGRTALEAWGDAFTAPLQRYSGKDKMRVSRLLGVGHEMIIGSFMSRFSAEDLSQGSTAGLMNKFFKLNLLGPWTDSLKAGVTMMISNDLATNASRTFDNLLPEHRRLLDINGIDEKQWNVIRQAVHKAEDGTEYILPGDIAGVEGSVFNGMSKFQQERLKEQARENLFTMYANEADYAVITPGAQEQSLLTQGLTPDTRLGQAIRLLTQFKAFPVAVLNKAVGRQVHGGGTNMQMVNLIAGTSLLGIGIVQLKEMAKGREPLPWDKDLMFRGMLQGGALGIYGDLILNRHNEYGGNVLTTMAGPIPNDVIQLFNVGQDVLYGEVDSGTARTAAQIIKGNLPLSNLFYTKMAYDYLITYQIMELMNPGYVQRMERNLKNRTGQEYFVSPSDIVQRGGGFQ